MKILFITILAFGLAYSPSFAKKDKSKQIPPGLEKKVECGGELPPGWQKKLKKGEILDQQVYDKGVVIKPVDKDGLITIRVEGKIIKLIKATKEIVDVLNE
jgi:hypothetical protein